MNLPKVYEPAEYEAMIYDLWEKSGAFQPKQGNKDTFSIVVPPPNANGNLHLGHALTLGIEDVAIRYHRMKGKSVLLVPGADHAGFETQVVYEKVLEKQGRSRFDFSREELYQQIWDFVAQNRENYESQFRKLGASVDWSHYTYTLDDKIVKQAYSSFKKMWNEGLIYRGERLVNFCTFHGTGFSDIEVEFKEESGHLWYIKYPLTDGSDSLTIATTRPETLLGDVAVAVHPDDERYKNFIGKTLKLPLTNREIPVVADDMVAKDLGSGAVKITPAHDQNDYDLAERHDLPMIKVIDHEGNMTHDVPNAYRGLEILVAREAIVSDLDKQGSLVKVDEHSHSVGHCYKCGTIIQPLLREQWFIAMDSLAKPAIKALKEDNIKFHPDSKKRVLINYLQGLRDWNISRQIAWGIPIPAFQNLDNSEDWIYDERVDQEIIEVEGKSYKRDPDVFDTWFSSSSWPYATLDFPDGQDFKDFYPISLMETGADILFPWVSRMIMFGLYNTGQVPFKEVYLHGLILDEHGQKMSKSKGNVVNPMDKLEKYGSDALRLGLITGQTPGSNQPYGEPKLIGARNFCNKLWNVARFVEAKVGDDYADKHTPIPTSPADHWMLSKLQQSSKKIDELMENYRFSEASEVIYHLLWDDFADWYIESSKTELNNSVLAYGLEVILKLSHPFVPFLTETIWQTLKWEGDTLLIASKWPTVKPGLREQTAVFEAIRGVVVESRAIISNLGLVRPHLYHRDSVLLSDHGQLVKQLAKLDGVSKVKAGNGLNLTQTSEDCWIAVDQETAKNYLSKLEEQQNAEALSTERLRARLANKSYIDNAPKELVEETKHQLEQSEAKLVQITAEIDSFSEASKEL